MTLATHSSPFRNGTQSLPDLEEAVPGTPVLDVFYSSMFRTLRIRGVRRECFFRRMDEEGSEVLRSRTNVSSREPLGVYLGAVRWLMRGSKWSLIRWEQPSRTNGKVPNTRSTAELKMFNWIARPSSPSPLSPSGRIFLARTSTSCTPHHGHEETF